jgi:hypothetical protein
VCECRFSYLTLVVDLVLSGASLVKARHCHLQRKPITRSAEALRGEPVIIADSDSDSDCIFRFRFRLQIQIQIQIADSDTDSDSDCRFR